MRRLREELGFTTDLEKIFDFTYRSEFENGLTEFEFDHVFVGTYDEAVFPNKEEVNDYCFKPLDVIGASLDSDPEKYTAWFHLAFPLVRKWISSHSQS
jgi:isopentenyl-diphosphate delta-isomerase